MDDLGDPGDLEARRDEAGAAGGEPRFRRSPSALWRTSLDGMVLLSGDAPHDPTVLPPVAFVDGSIALVWELLANPRSIASLAAEIAEHFAVDATSVATSIEPVVVELEAAGLLVRC